MHGCEVLEMRSKYKVHTGFQRLRTGENNLKCLHFHIHYMLKWWCFGCVVLSKYMNVYFTFLFIYFFMWLEMFNYICGLPYICIGQCCSKWLHQIPTATQTSPCLSQPAWTEGTLKGPSDTSPIKYIWLYAIFLPSLDCPWQLLLES